MYSDLVKQYVSQANLFHSFPLSLKFGITDAFSSSNGPSGDPIAAPSTSM